MVVLCDQCLALIYYMPWCAKLFNSFSWHLSVTFAPNVAYLCLASVALNWWFWIENRAIHEITCNFRVAARVDSSIDRLRFEFAILNRFSAILLYCDSCASRCGNSGNSRPRFEESCNLRFAIPCCKVPGQYAFERPDANRRFHSKCSCNPWRAAASKTWVYKILRGRSCVLQRAVDGAREQK